MTLDTGDYSLPELHHDVAIETKRGDLTGLFGCTTSALGERVDNLDRFREEMRRGMGMAFFCIVIAWDMRLLFAEAERRWEARSRRDGGRTFDPLALHDLLLSFLVDLGVPFVFASSHSEAERVVGTMLARVASQTAGGKAASKARARGSARGWLPVAP